MANDLYGFNLANLRTPLTADKATIDWGGPVTAAIQLSVAYMQQVQRRRTIGNRDAVIWATMPQGQITIARLLTTDATSLFTAPGWKACEPGTITLNLGGGCDGATAFSLTALHCIVSQFSLQAEAESLTVMDNVVIEFLQLQPS
jgi:hypothetical protein